jgi:polyisoprenoid-binding protein YceI
MRARTLRQSRIWIPGLVLASVLVLARAAGAQDYVVDPAVSKVGFSVGFLFGTVHGRFEAFEGRATLHGGQLASVRAVVRSASINTNNGRRDRHLRSDHFFDADKFPAIEFRSTMVEQASEARLRLKGLLTIRGVTREVALEGELRPKGDGTRYAFRAEATVNRQDWGISWNQHADGMDLLIRDQVHLVLEGELTGGVEGAGSR